MSNVPKMVEYDNGDKLWYLNGERHREDGPAVEYSNGEKSWYLNGEKHREDGPAVERANGDKEWFINGKKISEEEFYQLTTSNAPEMVEGKKNDSDDKFVVFNDSNEQGFEIMDKQRLVEYANNIIETNQDYVEANFNFQKLTIEDCQSKAFEIIFMVMNEECMTLDKATEIDALTSDKSDFHLS